MNLVYKVYKNYGDSVRKDILLGNIDNLLIASWGKFDCDYQLKSIVHSYLLCVVYDGNKLVALAPIKKMEIFGSPVYSFGLTVVHPKYRGKKLLKKMGIMLIKKIVIENILRLKFRIELIFITPNIRTLGTIAKYADFIYPNPHLADKDGRIGEADEETWKRVKEFLKVSKEHVTKLEREGMVMEGFYEKNPHLVFRTKVDHINKKLDLFGEKYLYNKPGRELVVRAVISWKGIIRAYRAN